MRTEGMSPPPAPAPQYVHVRASERPPTRVVADTEKMVVQADPATGTRLCPDAACAGAERHLVLHPVETDLRGSSSRPHRVPVVAARTLNATKVNPGSLSRGGKSTQEQPAS